MKEKLKTNIISLGFTTLIIGLLILSGPAEGQDCNGSPGYGYGYGYGYGEDYGYGYGYGGDYGYGYGYGSSYDCEPVVEERKPVSAPTSNVVRFIRGVYNPELEVKDVKELLEFIPIEDPKEFDLDVDASWEKEEEWEPYVSQDMKDHLTEEKKGFISKVFSSIGDFFGNIFGWLFG